MDRTRGKRSRVEKGKPLEVHLAACIAIAGEWIISGGSFGAVLPNVLLSVVDLNW